MSENVVSSEGEPEPRWEQGQQVVRQSVHQLNNAFAVIIGLASLMQYDANFTDEKHSKADLQKILDAARRGNNVTQKLSLFFCPPNPEE